MQVVTSGLNIRIRSLQSSHPLELTSSVTFSTPPSVNSKIKHEQIWFTLKQNKTCATYVSF